MIIGNNRNVPLTPGLLEPAVLSILDGFNAQSQLPVFIEAYIEHSGIEETRFNEEVRATMVDHLLTLGAEFESVEAVERGDYDELFALAYEIAISRQAGRNDPIDAAWSPGGGTIGAGWDFSVDLFDDVERQGVVADNILAAGAIDYIYELGEHMGIFRLLDALVLNWASGSIDVVEGDIVSRLYRYWKRHDDRMSPEERGMVYRRVLNKGETDVLDRMVTNERFPTLWHNLMSEVADFIDKTERVDKGTTESSPVSRARIFQATRLLQYNLTEFCTGMAHIQARELYAQLQECLDLLRDPDVLAYFGGNRRKNLWTVIEKMSAQEFGESPDIAALRSLAVDGNAIFSFVANFTDGGVRQQDFARFLEAAEAYILNYTTVGGDPAPVGDDEETDEPDDEENDEF
jgi:hypothetical protein